MIRYQQMRIRVPRIQVAWTAEIISLMGRKVSRMSSHFRDVILTEFSKRVYQHPDTFGTNIAGSLFYSTQVLDKKVFVISELLSSNNVVVVRAIAEQPVENIEDVRHHIAEAKSL